MKQLLFCSVMPVILAFLFLLLAKTEIASSAAKGGFLISLLSKCYRVGYFAYGAGKLGIGR